MSKIKLMKNPGYIEDLFFIFFLNFNTEYCKKNFIGDSENVENKNEYKSKISFFDEVLKIFERSHIFPCLIRFICQHIPAIHNSIARYPIPQ